jgi:hypothetical protein
VDKPEGKRPLIRHKREEKDDKTGSSRNRIGRVINFRVA